MGDIIGVRCARLFADGSMSIGSSRAEVDTVCRQAVEEDVNETDPSKFTRVAIVRVEIVEYVPVSRTIETVCPTCGQSQAA